MTNTHYHRDTCRLCGSRNLELALALTPTPPADAYVPVDAKDTVQEVFPLDLYLCRECGLSQLCEVIRAESIYVDYIYETKSSLGLVEHFRNYANDVLNRIRPLPGSLIVDIGSNDGTLLKPFKDCGMTVLGVDPACEIAHAATTVGIETLPEFFTAELAKTIKRERGPASVVTANNIFANVDELVDFTNSLHGLLAPDGVFIFESFYLGDLLENMVFDFIYHEHLSSFSVKPLIKFFSRHGMELIDARRVATKGGSLRYTVQLAGGPRSISQTVRDLIAEEEQRGLARLETFKIFDTNIRLARAKCTELLDSLKMEGKAIAGYGASATSTTLIYHFGLGRYLDYLVDEYSRKQNTLSPGLHLPVLAPSALLARKTDHAVILAWRYVDPIVKKNRSFQDAGGRFIVPLPTLQVI